MTPGQGTVGSLSAIVGVCLSVGGEEATQVRRVMFTNIKNEV